MDCFADKNMGAKHLLFSWIAAGEEGTCTERLGRTERKAARFNGSVHPGSFPQFVHSQYVGPVLSA